MMQASAAETIGFGMNTEISHKVFGEHAQEALIAAKAELIRLENKLSRFIPESEINRINRSAGRGPVTISMETYKVISHAVRLSEISQGLFDISAGPLIDLWNYKHAFRGPGKIRIRRILPYVNFRDLILDSHKQTARLRKRGQSIDLGGIGKGFAGDCCMNILKCYGIVSAFINIGGNASTLGNKPDGSPWRVGIRHPRSDGCLLGAVEVTGKAVVTSGDYERYFIDRRGMRRHHILNPSTGYPAQSGLISVTVVADSALTADGLSTAIFVAGMDRGLKYLTHFPGTEAVLVDNRLRVYITQGLKECYKTAADIPVNIIRKELLL